MNDTQKELTTNVREIAEFIESGASVEWLQSLNQRLGDDITDFEGYKLLVHQIREVQTLYTNHSKEDQEVLCNAIKIAMRIGYEAEREDLKLQIKFVRVNYVANVVFVWSNILRDFRQEVELIWTLLNEEERSVFEATSDLFSVDSLRCKRKRGHTDIAENVVEIVPNIVKIMQYGLKIKMMSVVSDAVENSNEKMGFLMTLLQSINKCEQHLDDVGEQAMKINYIPQIPMGAFGNVASFLHLAILEKNDFDLLVFRTILEHLEHAEWQQEKVEGDAAWIQLSCQIWLQDCQDKQPCIVREVRDFFFSTEQKMHTVAMYVQCTDAKLTRPPSCTMTKLRLKFSVQVHSKLRNVVVFVGLGGVLVYKTQTIQISA